MLRNVFNIEEQQTKIVLDCAIIVFYSKYQNYRILKKNTPLTPLKRGIRSANIQITSFYIAFFEKKLYLELTFLVINDLSHRAQSR